MEYRWVCSECSGDNSVDLNASCSYCNDHWRAEHDYVYRWKPSIVEGEKTSMFRYASVADFDAGRPGWPHSVLGPRMETRPTTRRTDEPGSTSSNNTESVPLINSPSNVTYSLAEVSPGTEVGTSHTDASNVGTEKSQPGQSEIGPASSIRDERTHDGLFENHLSFYNDLDCFTPEEEDSASVVSDSPSIFSTASLTSSISNITGTSGYSAMQIVTASKELLSVLREDEELASLYQIAIQETYIGSSKLQKYLRQSFKTYAKNLDKEASDTLEFLTSKLVSLKASHIARSIVEELYRNSTDLPIGPQLDQPDDDDDDRNNNEDATRQADDYVSHDLVLFRQFLVESEAFYKLRAQIQSFVLSNRLPKKQTDMISPTKTSKNPKSCTPAEKKLSWGIWSKELEDMLLSHQRISFLKTVLFGLAIDAWLLTTDEIFIALGRLEPPLEPTMTRLRWKSMCGEAIFSDVKELRQNGVANLVAHMGRSTGTKVYTAPHSQQAGSQRYIWPRPILWVQNGITKATTGLNRWTSKASPSLPHHNNSHAATTVSASIHNMVTQPALHLMLCMNRKRSRKYLQQGCVTDIGTNRDLFCFIRQQYASCCAQMLAALSFKRIRGIHFVKFDLSRGGDVIIRDHTSHCSSTTTMATRKCECIPPASKVEPSPAAEYRCLPGPPATVPVVPPEYLAEKVLYSSIENDDDDWILRLVPKRTCGKLQGKKGQLVEGWGLHVSEGVDRDLVAVCVFTLLLLASLLFGILWSVFKYDVQGAFGISAYMMTVCAILLHITMFLAEKPR